MTVIHESKWHPFEVTVIEGCRADGRQCTQHCPEPCEDEREIELDCAANGCPEVPEDRPRCEADYVLTEGHFEDDFSALAPGRYRLRYRTTRDYEGEYDEEIEIEEVPV